MVILGATKRYERKEYTENPAINETMIVTG
jgi:hypothetical protein